MARAYAKYFNGSVWVPFKPKLFGGIPLQWRTQAKIYDGTNWRELYGDPVLTLNALSSINSATTGTREAGIQVLPDGRVTEWVTGPGWVAQNTGTEWIDDNGASSSNYRARFVPTDAGDSPTYVGWTAASQWQTIDKELSIKISATGTGGAVVNDAAGTLYIEEIGNAANVVSASYTLVAELFGTT